MTREPDDVIEEWILDYVCSRAWKEFKLSKSLTSSTVEYITAVIHQDQNYLGTRKPKVNFLVVLSRLADGQKCFVEYQDEQELTVLEDMIPIFEELAQCQTSSLLQEGLGLIHAIKIEALLVCRRQKNVDLENKVAKRLWSEQTDGKKKGNTASKRDVLKNLVNQMRGVSDLKDVTYDDFLDSMITYLERVQKTFNKPRLLQFAETEMSRTSGEVTKKAYAGKKFTKDDFDKTIVTETKGKNSGKDFPHSKEKLRKLWNNNIEEIFGSTSPERHSTPSGNKSKTSQPRKRSSESDSDLEPPVQKSKVTSSANQDPLPSTSSANNSKTSKKQTSERDVFVPPKSSPQKNPAGYRKNQGRLNRHEPTGNTSNNNNNDSASSNDSFTNNSMVSTATCRRKWDPDEIEDFYNAVKKIGVGEWARIKEHLGTSRSNVMLKDKWRNMLKSGDVDMLEQKQKKKKK